MLVLLLLLLAQSELDLANHKINAGNTKAALAVLEAIRCGDETCTARKNSLTGAAHLYEAHYELALRHFAAAKEIYDRQGDARHSVDLLNNIGSVHFFRGEYAEANRSYQQALQLLGQNRQAAWHAEAYPFTIVNLATLQQKLGRNREALALYLSIDAKSLPASEQAQSLSNRAVLVRRLGDPYKAKALLEQALAILKKEPHQDILLGILKNLGIVLALDFHDAEAAARYFEQVREAADQSNDQREGLQARLYRAELALRSGDLPLAKLLWTQALRLSRESKSLEEEWRSLYGLARISGSRMLARQALDSIEGLRSGIGAPSLKSDFLADKSEVYEFTLALDYEHTDSESAFHTMERSRALSLREALPATPSLLGLKEFQARLEPDEGALVFETGKLHTYALWITAKEARLERLALPQALAAKLVGEREYRQLASLLFGNAMLPKGRLWVIPEGPLALIPLELLMPREVETAYLPAAWFLEAPQRAWRGVRFPWQVEMTAVASSTVADLLPGDEGLAALPGAKAEIAAIARILPGRTNAVETATVGALNRAPLLHLATHAVADPEASQRNRILLGSAYLYANQLKPGALDQVRLAVLSACDTSRGPQLRGEGVQSLSRAFLAAGAKATVASYWKVDDQATRQFMTAFYRRLEEGRSISGALLDARVRFRAAQAPQTVWAAFTVQGAARDRLPNYLSWTQLLLMVAGVLALASWWFSRRLERR